MNYTKENTYPVKGYLSYNKIPDSDFADSVTELTYNSVSTLRSGFYAEFFETLSKDLSLSHPKMFKITGGVLADSPLTAIGIAISAKEEGVLQATITGLGSSAITTAIAVTIIAPGIAAAGLTGSAAFGVGLLAVGLTGYVVDNLADVFYDNFLEKHIINTEINVEDNSLIFDTTMSNFKDLQGFASARRLGLDPTKLNAA